MQAPAFGFSHTARRLPLPLLPPLPASLLSFFSFPKSHHSPPTHVFCAHVTVCGGDTQPINQQTQQGQFRLDVTFKVLFSLYIQYTSQKYTVNLQRRRPGTPERNLPLVEAAEFQSMRIIKREECFCFLLDDCFFFLVLNSVHAFTSCADVTVEETLEKDRLDRWLS